jgi:uncharacterized membrane protein
MGAIQRSATFPPNDPWLSGYAISYYYFGYVMAAMMSMMAGVASTTGYNMHIALLFALTGTATFGVVYNLIRSRAFRVERGVPVLVSKAPSRQTAVLIGMLGMVFMILMSNFHTVIVELPYRTHTASEDYLEFWDTKERDSYGDRKTPLDILSPYQAGANRWWWFGASRVVTETNFEGERINEVIDEFPMFSFLLSDSHPHVMALPFVLLAMGLALNVILSEDRPDRSQTFFYGICLGGLIFLNTWDSPIYLMAIVGADVLRRVRKNAQGWLTSDDWIELVTFAMKLIAVMFVAYLPFLAGFRSQFAGLLPNMLHPTRFQQLFVMFGPFILILAVFLGIETRRASGRINLKVGLYVALGTLLVMILIVGVLLIAGRLSPHTWAQTKQFVADNGDWSKVISEIAERRVVRILTLLVLLTTIDWR